MAISLTREELLESWERHLKLWELPIEYDAKQFAISLQSAIKVTSDGNNVNIETDLTRPVAELLRITIIKLIDLVYSEDIP